MLPTPWQARSFTSLMVAGASEVHAAPNALASVTIDGHGNGHGYGLSQWGAYGYAVDHGWTWTQILDHYYGGTVAGTVPVDSMITVRLQNLDDAQTTVVGEQAGWWWMGSAVARGSPCSSARSLPAHTAWARTDAQVCPGASGDPATSGWAVVADSIAAQVNVRTQADSSPQPPATRTWRRCASRTARSAQYSGVIRAINDANGANRTVNEVRLEHYISPR